MDFGRCSVFQRQMGSTKPNWVAFHALAEGTFSMITKRYIHNLVPSTSVSKACLLISRLVQGELIELALLTYTEAFRLIDKILAFRVIKIFK